MPVSLMNEGNKQKNALASYCSFENAKTTCPKTRGLNHQPARKSSLQMTDRPHFIPRCHPNRLTITSPENLSA
jgi:hypothetical protein